MGMSECVGVGSGVGLGSWVGVRSVGVVSGWVRGAWVWFVLCLWPSFPRPTWATALVVLGDTALRLASPHTVFMLKRSGDEFPRL